MRKLIRPEYRRMQEVVRVRLSQQLSKCVFVILLFHLVQSFVFSVTMSPMVSTAGSRPSYLAIGISLLLTGGVVWTTFVFMYGIINFFTKVVLGRRDVMRVFTSGFRDRTRRSFGAAFVFSIIFAISAALALFVILTFKDRIFMLASDYFLDDGTEQQTVNFVREASLALVFYSVVFVSAIFIFIFISIPFLFTWNILLDDKKISVASAIVKSLSLMGRNYFHYIGFVISICLKNVFFIVILVFINSRISSAASSLSTIFSMIIGFFAFIHEYTILAKAYASIPVYYYSLLSVNGMIERKENESSAQ